MFNFVIKVIIDSILISILSYQLKLIPHYPKRKYSILMQLFNTGFLTILLTVLIMYGLYPSWIILFALIFFILLVSVQLTNTIVRRKS